MTFTIAGEKKEYEEGITLKELIEKEQIDNPDYVTVTINDEFIDKETFADTRIKEGDAVEFLYFMGGGAN
ncbi:MAG: sulfur carrier protein ThiS [Lachnospiraceae bacterium]|nr:sulfur carrier protein ThiS [Lachnospiraceae bacterium]